MHPLPSFSAAMSGSGLRPVPAGNVRCDVFFFLLEPCDAAMQLGFEEDMET